MRPRDGFAVFRGRCSGDHADVRAAGKLDLPNAERVHAVFAKKRSPFHGLAIAAQENRTNPPSPFSS